MKISACVSLVTRLHCYVVSGLNNFEVGVSNVFPTVGSPVSTDSYTLCGRYNGSVTGSQTITVSCASMSQQFRYVVVRSSDATPERLCIAEVAVYATSQYAITFVCIEGDSDVIYSYHL